ncbi:MAG: UbiD family decarboxylase [Chloroflexi bacterium]|nr:UbiD family decarboxylase [Chloroflexota bacterium]
MIARDMREFISLLESQGELVRIRSEVDPNNFELSSVIRHIEDSSNEAIFFERVKGYTVPVAANLYGSWKRCAIACGVEVTPEDIVRYRRDPHGSPGGLGGRSEIVHEGYTMTDEQRARAIVLRQRIQAADDLAAKGAHPAKVVPTGACKEVIVRDDIDLLRMFPMPWLCEGDVAPFINPGCLVQRDPDTGVLNVGVRRHQVGYEPYGGKRMGALIIESTDGGKILKKYEERDMKCEVALCIGPDPVTFLMGCFNTTHFQSPNPWSEFDIVGALRKEPLELVRCETVDLEVPANTEIVIEGFIPPGERIMEGPMGELTGLYTWRRPLPYIEITAITYRKNPIVHVLMSGRSRDQLATGNVATSSGTERRILERVRQSFPTVKDVAVYGGSHNFHLVVSLKKRFEGEDKLLLYNLMATTFHKYITIVDDDIEPHNMEMVEWSKAVRAGANADDFIVFPKTHTWEMDPEIDDDITVTRLGILATLPYGEKYVRAGPPREMVEKMRSLVEKELSSQKRRP